MMDYLKASQPKYKKIPLMVFVRHLKKIYKTVHLFGYHISNELEIQAMDKNNVIWYLELDPKKRYTYTLQNLKNKWYNEKYRG